MYQMLFDQTFRIKNQKTFVRNSSASSSYSDTLNKRRSHKSHNNITIFSTEIGWRFLKIEYLLSVLMFLHTVRLDELAKRNRQWQFWINRIETFLFSVYNFFTSILTFCIFVLAKEGLSYQLNNSTKKAIKFLLEDCLTHVFLD